MVHSFPTRRSSDLVAGLLRVRGRAHDEIRGQQLRVRDRSEEHTSELQSHHPISYAVFCLTKKKLQCLSAAFAPVWSGRRAAMRSRFATSFPAGFAFLF